ncbi:hypothetical protein AB1Y20_004948 [Prymnesium parvum]|uniref:Uncharacterized protein n=1 Tax=Prymnesium parvum TaxID=97485 RepID=A0AB34J4U5_PRYPA
MYGALAAWRCRCVALLPRDGDLMGDAIGQASDPLIAIHLPDMFREVLLPPYFRVVCSHLSSAMQAFVLNFVMHLELHDLKRSGVRAVEMARIHFTSHASVNC